jgi:uncharacterized membrane protein
MPEHTVFKIVSVLVLVGVLVLSFLPSDSVDPIRLNIGYSVDIGHVLAYALLAGATMLSVPRQALTLWRGVGIVFTISLLGIAIELLQPLVGRTTSVVDFTENEAGVAGGIAIFCGYCFVEKVRTRGSRKRPAGG